MLDAAAALESDWSFVACYLVQWGDSLSGHP